MATVQDFLLSATKQLTAAGIGTARLDCLVLLEDVLNTDRALLLAHPEREISATELHTLNTYITQRKSNIPLAYIRGKAAFFGRFFAVDTHVLVPRPETEIMIEMLLQCSLPDHPHIADIGTGSGCLGITAALELPQANVVLYDIDAAALAVAKRNAQVHNAQVSLQQQDLLSGSEAISLDVLLANLPYVPDDYPINDAARHEPSLALFAGKDGLDCYRTFWQQIAQRHDLPAHVLTESLAGQHEAMTELAGQAGYALAAAEGLIQHFTPA